MYLLITVTPPLFPFPGNISYCSRKLKLHIKISHQDIRYQDLNIYYGTLKASSFIKWCYWHWRCFSLTLTLPMMLQKQIPHGAYSLPVPSLLTCAVTSRDQMRPQMVTGLVRGEWAEIKFIMLRFCNSRDQNTLWRGHKNYFPQPLGSRGVLRAVMMSPLLSHVVPQFPHYPLCARSFSWSAEGVTSKWSSRFCHAGHI